jgi:hypothetical protein
LPVLALALTGPITYLYLPLVDRLGSDWVFSAPGTWQGFWALILDTKAGRIVSIPGTFAALGERLKAVIGLLNDDWPMSLWIAGLLGLSFLWKMERVERAALALAWTVYLALSAIIWEGFVSDALLAVKLPVIAMAAVGLAFLAAELARRSHLLGRLALVGGVALVGFLFLEHRPRVLEITRDASAAQTIAAAEGIEAADDGQPITLMALWGNDFWQLAYAQSYKGRFPQLNLVDHNANFARILARGDHLYTLSRTFLTRPLPTWEERLGPVQLSSAAPGIVEIRRKGEQGTTAPGEAEDLLQLDNGIAIHEATLSWQDEQSLLLSVEWRAVSATDVDYSVAVHLVSHDPPDGPEDILAQADSVHPVDGRYPTSGWEQGELVRDHYLLAVPPGSAPVAVRLGMYRVLEGGQFENTAMLSLPLP